MQAADRTAEGRSALWITATYAGVAAAWIFFSDRLLEVVFGPIAQEWQTPKGLLFVLVTAGLLYTLMRREFAELHRAQAAVRESEARYRTLFEHSSDAIFIADAHGRYVDVNARGCALLGYTRDELLRLRTTHLIPPEDLAAPPFQTDDLRSGRAVLVERRLQRKDGAPVPVEISARQLPDGRLQAFVRDISERRQAAERLRQQFEMLTALYAVARRLSLSLELDEVAVAVARECVEAFGARLAWLGEARPDGEVAPLAHWPPEHPYPRQIHVRWDAGPESAGPTGRAIREGRPVVAADVAADGDLAPWQAPLAAAGLCASAAFPLISRDQALGAFNVYSDQPGFFTPERIELFQAFAHQAGAALANARLFRSVTEQREQLHGLAARLAEVDEAERRRVARELHDSVGANLTALNLNLTLIRSQLTPQAEAAVGARLADTAALLQETMAQVRDVMMNLRPSVLDDYGLLAALRWHTEQMARRSGLRLAVTGDEPDPRLPPAAETALFRIAQEALTNVVKHAQAACVRLQVETDGAAVRLTIADDGRGFEPPPAAPDSRGAHGWGLSLMRERALAVGAELRVDSAPGRGTRVIVEAPR